MSSVQDEETDIDDALDAFLKRAGKEEAASLRDLLPVEPLADLLPGGTFGDYQLLNRIGSGGMGIVYEARDIRSDGCTVALKVLRGTLVSEQAVQRFQREANAIRRLDHPGVVPVIAAGVSSGFPYLVMKLVAGMPLRMRLEELREKQADTSGAEHLRWVANLGQRLADALEHAHSRGVIHRDVTPGNVMVSPAGHPVLLDFGLASLSEEETLTETGQFLGTLAYSSPEQLAGERVDERSDVWSVGVILFEMMMLARPFEAPSVNERLQLIARSAPPRMPNCASHDLAAIVQRCLEGDRERRYLTAQELAGDLRAFLAGEALGTRPLSRSRLAWRAIRNHPRSALALFTMIVVPLAVSVTAALSASAKLARGSQSLARWKQEASAIDLERSNLAALTGLLAPWSAAYSDRVDEVRSGLHGLQMENNALLRAIELDLAGTDQVFGIRSRARAALADLHAARLEQALSDLADLRFPDQVGILEERLRNYDDLGQHSELLNPMGWVQLTSVPVNARLQLLRWDRGRDDWRALDGLGAVVADGRRRELPEGSYLARVTTTGYQELSYPFLVRRGLADQPRTYLPSREHNLHLRRPAEVMDGFILIPAGWTLIDADPPRWSFVEEFQIQRYEMTVEALVESLNAHGVQVGDNRQLPPGGTFTVPYDASTGIWSVSQADGRLPARQLSQSDAEWHARRLQFLLPSRSPDSVTALPTRDQWVRAARGADARPYPWGWASPEGMCCWHRATGDGLHEPKPDAVDEYPKDLSVFGVRGMSASVSEHTRDVNPKVIDESVQCGGSYRTVDPSDLSVTAATMRYSGSYWDVGWRAVYQELPAAMRVVETPPADFFASFADAHSGELRAPWFMTIGSPFEQNLRKTAHQGCFIEGGLLICESRVGNFSARSGAWTRISLGSGDFELTATIRGRQELRSQGHGFGFMLAASMGQCDPILDLAVGAHGDLYLDLDGEKQKSQLGYSVEGRWINLQVRVIDNVVEGRAWPLEGERPGASQISGIYSGPRPALHFIGLAAGSLVGARMEVRDLRSKQL